MAEFGGIEAFALASRSWVSSPGPSEELVAMVSRAPDDKALRSYLEAGCRHGSSGEWIVEVGPWLDAWDREAQAKFVALRAARRAIQACEAA